MNESKSWICEKCGKPLGKFLHFPKTEKMAIWDDEDVFVSVTGIQGKIYKIAFLKMEVECVCGHQNILENEPALSKLNRKPIGSERLNIEDKKISIPYTMSDKIEEVFNYESGKKLFISEKSKTDLLRRLSPGDKDIIMHHFKGENVGEISHATGKSEEQVKMRLHKIIEEEIKPINKKETEEELDFIAKNLNQ